MYIDITIICGLKYFYNSINHHSLHDLFVSLGPISLRFYCDLPESKVESSQGRVAAIANPWRLGTPHTLGKVEGEQSEPSTCYTFLFFSLFFCHPHSTVFCLIAPFYVSENMWIRTSVWNANERMECSSRSQIPFNLNVPLTFAL